MFDVFQAQYLITTRNDPMGIDKGVYAILPGSNSGKYVRLNRGPVGVPVEFKFFEKLFYAFNNSTLGALANTGTLIFHGGDSQIDDLYMLHSSDMKFGSSAKANLSGINYYTALAEYLKSNDEDTIPALSKFVFGHQFIAPDQLRTKCRSGDWSVVSAPSFIAFGTKSDAIYATTKRLGIVESTRRKGVFGNLLTGIQLIRGLKRMGLVAQLNIVRSALFVYYISKNEKPFDFEYLEKVIDVQIRNIGHEMGEITDLIEKLSREDLNIKHRTLKARTMRFPLAKENKRMREISEEIGLNRYAYDYAFSSQMRKKDQTDNKGSASARNLERHIDAVGEIVKDSDQTRPWD